MTIKKQISLIRQLIEHHEFHKSIGAISDFLKKNNGPEDINRFSELKSYLELLLSDEAVTNNIHKTISGFLLNFITKLTIQQETPGKDGNYEGILNEAGIEGIKESILDLIQELDSAERSLITIDNVKENACLTDFSLALKEKVFSIRYNIKKRQNILLKVDENSDKKYKSLKKTFTKSFDEELANHILTFDIEDYEVTRKLALYHQQKKQYQYALQLFNRISDSTPIDITLLIDKASLFSEQQNYGKAIELLTTALVFARQEKENTEDILLQLAKVYLENEQWKNAEQTYGRLLEIDLKNIKARKGIVEVYLQQNEIGIALDSLHHILSIAQNDLGVIKLIGLLYYKQRDYSNARAYLSKYVSKYLKKNNEDDKKIKLLLARVFKGLEEYDTSLSNYEDYIQYFPQNNIAISEYGKLCHKQKKHNGGIQYLHNTIESANYLQSEGNFERVIFVLIELGQLYLQNSEPSKTIELLDTNSPYYTLEYSGLYNNEKYYKYDRILAEAYLAQHEFKRAHECIDRALRKAPKNARCWQIRGKVFIEQDTPDYDDAMDAFNKAEELENTVEFLYNLDHPVKIKSLRLTGLSFFTDFTWECKNVNILLGRNGYGKSHLMRFFVSLLQKEHKISLNFFANSKDKAKAMINLERVGFDHKKEKIVRESTKFTGIGKVPVLAIPDVRYMNKSRSAVSPFGEDEKDFSEDGSFHFLYEKPYEGLIENFFYKLCIIYLEQISAFDNPRKLFEQVPIFKLLEDTFENLTDLNLKFHSITRVGETRFRIKVITDGNDKIPLPIQKTSQGTLSILAMFGLVYSFLEAVYPNVAQENLNQQPGIVFIDEVDAHLHPSWQREIVPMLTKNFPRIQFFFTAHSPLIVAGCKEREVAVLRKEGEEFNLVQLSDHFIGVKTDKIFKKVFEVEDGNDKTYLEYNMHQLKEKEYEEDIQYLREKREEGELTNMEENILENLLNNIRSIRLYRDINVSRKKAKQIEKANERLTMENIILKNQIEALKNHPENE